MARTGRYIGLVRGEISEEARRRVSRIWRSIYEHPFVVLMERGELPIDKLRLYIEQDYLFLKEYARCLVNAAARAADAEVMELLVRLAYATFEFEKPAQLRFARALGLDEAQLRDAKMAPLTREYLDYLFRVSTLGTIAEVAASLSPCAWTYMELGNRIAHALEQKYHFSAADIEWWRAYSSPDYEKVVSSMKAMMRYAKSPAERARVLDYFTISSEYEKAFWDMSHMGK